MWAGRLHRAEAGQSLIEFALTLPLIIALTVGVADLGRALLTYTTLGNIVREAAREAAVHGLDSSQPWGPAANDPRIVTAVRSRATGLVAGNVSVTSSWPAGNNAGDSEVVVIATYPFNPIATTVVGNLTVTISATTRTRIYR